MQHCYFGIASVMAVKITCALVLALAVTAHALDSFEDASMKLVLKVYDDCSKADGFSTCLKKKAITFLDRLGRMDKLNVADGVSIVRDGDSEAIQQNLISEEQLEQTLPRGADAKDAALHTMLLDKLSTIISSRKLQITMPKISAQDLDFEGRKKKGGMGMMGGMMMGMAAKMAALVPIAIAGLFILAGKALITAKIALLISGIIAIKKLISSKNSGGGGGGHGGGWQSGGGGGGWQSGGGGWDKRSLDEAQKLAYKAYS